MTEVSKIHRQSPDRKMSRGQVECPFKLNGIGLPIQIEIAATTLKGN